MCVIDDRHKGHQVTPIKVMARFQKVRKRLRRTKLVLAARVTDLRSTLSQMNQVVDHLDKKSNKMRKKVDIECDAMIELIEKQRLHMYDQLEQLIEKKQERKQKQISTIHHDIEKTNVMLKRIQDILETEEPEQFLNKVKSSNIPIYGNDFQKFLAKLTSCKPSKNSTKAAK
jgi:vacuolar-type H+-ATPase subunit I/STV1